MTILVTWITLAVLVGITFVAYLYATYNQRAEIIANQRDILARLDGLQKHIASRCDAEMREMLTGSRWANGTKTIETR